MDPKEQVLEAVTDLKKNVDDRISIATQPLEKDLADVKEQLQTDRLTKEEVTGYIEEILFKAQKEKEQKLQIPGGGMRTTREVKLPNFWGSDPHALISSGDVDIQKMIETEGVKALDTVISIPAVDDNHRYLQELSFDAWILDQMAKATTIGLGRPYAGFKATYPKWSKMFGKFVDMYMGQFKATGDNALDTTEHADWVPARFSSQAMELITIQLRVAALFERFTMPGSPFTFPVDLTDTVGTYHTESTSTASNNPWDDVTHQTAVDEDVIFIARKLRARFVTSSELTEDSMLAILPRLRKHLIKIQANSEEQAVLDGDRSATHMDTDVAILGATDVRKAISGLRFFCIDNSYKTDNSAATYTDQLLGIRKSLGEHGIIPDDLANIVGLSMYIDLLKVDVVETVDKYGAFATVLNGELGKVYGTPIIVSRYVREDVTALGVNDTTGNTRTYAMVVHRDTFMIGDLRKPTLESERMLNTDQVNVVSWRRMDLQYMYGATAKPVAWMAIDITP